MSTHNIDSDLLELLSDIEELESNKETLNTINNLPKWVSKDNASFKGYVSLIELEVEKKAYINSHQFKRKKTHAKKAYSISSREVARRADVAVQTLFHNNVYSKDLTVLLSSINKALEKLFELKRCKKAKHKGNKTKTVDDLVSSLHRAEEKAKKNEIELLELVYARTVKNIPPDIRERLRIRVTK